MRSKSPASAEDERKTPASAEAPSFPKEGREGMRLVFDWSYALIESSSETFEQLKWGFEEGIVTEDEMRNWLFP